jgi:hypothetical protein
MSNAKRCDRCGKLYSNLNHTLSGSISARAIGWTVTHYYPEHYDFCGDCADSLATLIAMWFKDNWYKRKEVSDDPAP